MGDFALWPYFLCIAALVALAALPGFQALDVPTSGKTSGHGSARRDGLDGLRGLLAVSVAIGHAEYFHHQLMQGTWDVPGEFFKQTGLVAVGQFFMITGFLFWSRILRERGKPDWIKLFIGRVFRIGPVYLVFMLVVFAMVADRSGYRLGVPGDVLLRQVVRWLGLGLLGNPDLNGCACSGGVLSGMTWTLYFEWMFYLCLPLGALFVRWIGWSVLASALLVGAALVAIALLPKASAGPLSQAALFALGMLSASIVARHPWLIAGRRKDRVASVMAAALLAVCFTGLSTGSGTIRLLLMWGAFHLIVAGCSLFGVLTSRGARRLGAMSYGIYLLHGAVLLWVFALPGVRALDARSGPGHWAVVLLGGIALVFVAAAVHIVVERPCIALGRRAGSGLGRPATGTV